MYLEWWDDNPKKTTAAKIAEAIAAYVARFQARPAEVLACELDRGELREVDGVPVRSAANVRRHNVWVGGR